MKRFLMICIVACLMLAVTGAKADVITNVYRWQGDPTYYWPEIVAWPDGLQEGAQAYLDRWGGPIGKNRYYHWEEIPDELIGADYIKTNNRDKGEESSKVIHTVKVGQKSRLYIFIDHRYVDKWGDPPFSWLTDGSSQAVFTYTGLQIYLHEAREPLSPDDPLRLFYIYAAEVPTGHKCELRGTWDGSGSRNFYGIAAVGLVDIDIKPGSNPNAVNLGSEGVVPVAILSSPSFNAATVDPDTITLGGASVAVRGKTNKSMAHQEDVNGDGLPDLVCQVETENLDPGYLQTGEAILTGRTYDGHPVQGKDDIVIVPNG